MLAFAKEIAQAAGALLRQKLLGPRTVHSKSTDSDLVTDADKASEALLVEAISRRYPDHHILGEEGTGDASLLHQEGYVWVIDPLDGTVNYAHGIPIFAVSVGLLRDGVPELGVIYVPMLDELFAGQTGQGATLNDQPIAVSKTQKLSDSLLATGFSYDKHCSDQDNLANVQLFVKRIRGLRRLGAACVDLAYVACGRLDGYWEDKIHPWDIAAGIVLVREAGGQVSGFTGAPPILDAQHLIASNPHLHPQILPLLAPYAREFGLD